MVPVSSTCTILTFSYTTKKHQSNRQHHERKKLSQCNEESLFMVLGSSQMLSRMFKPLEIEGFLDEFAYTVRMRTNHTSESLGFCVVVKHLDRVRLFGI